jgi:hypothetical protein
MTGGVPMDLRLTRRAVLGASALGGLALVAPAAGDPGRAAPTPDLILTGGRITTLDRDAARGDRRRGRGRPFPGGGPGRRGDGPCAGPPRAWSTSAAAASSPA